MLKFPKSAVDVGPLRDEIRRVFVHATRHLPSLGLVPADDARRAQREDPGRDFLRVHVVDRALGRPLRSSAARGIAAMSGERLCIEGWHEMLMNVTTMSSAHSLLLVLENRPNDQRG